MKAHAATQTARNAIVNTLTTPIPWIQTSTRPVLKRIQTAPNKIAEAKGAIWSGAFSGLSLLAFITCRQLTDQLASQSVYLFSATINY
jgi:hypothetical protein